MSDQSGGLIACHECDRVYREEPVPPGARALCRNCGALLYRHIPDSLNRTLALYVAALVLFALANSYPFLTMKSGSLIVESTLWQSGWALYQAGMGELGLVVFLTSIGFPFLVITGMLYLLVPLRFGRVPFAIGPVFRMVNALMPWSLVGIFALGTLVSVVKLQDLASVIPGTALFAFFALLILYSAARANFDPRQLWAFVPYRQPDPAAIERGEPLVSCHGCGLLQLERNVHGHCPRCGAAMHRRVVNSVQKTWALVISAAILFIPANTFPIMTYSSLGKGDPDTIISGIMKLAAGGMYGLAIVIFFASFVVPLAKLISLVFLLRTVEKKSTWRPRDRTLLYRVTELVGAWSMVDVFLVGLLTALVSLGALASVTPGLGATFFAAVVVITMIAAHTFDPRLIWDNCGAKA